MEANSQKLENVRTTILSLLLARKGGSTLRQLDNDYCEVEGTHVPWKDFGYISLLNFLQSMKKNVQIEHINNTIILKGIATDKSKHVSRLVAGQKSQAHMVGRKVFKPSHYYPRTAPPKVPIPADILLNVIGLINNHPEGVNKDYIFQKVQSHMPFVSIQMQDMEEQFRELSHKIFFKNNKIYPVESKSKTFDYSEKVNGLSSSNDGQDQRSPVVTAGGEEDSDDLLDYDDDDDEFAFTPRMKATTKPTSNFIKETVSKYQDQITEATSNVQYEHNSSHYLGDQDFNNDDQFHMKCNNDTKENRRDSWEGEILINERVKFRLEKLIQNRPNGIWCAELPELYLEEYKVSLNYTELGFNSVREFASQLPEIFYCMQPHGTGDFMLYYAKKEIPSNKIKETYKSNTLAQLHQIYEPKEEDALPVTVSLDICKELIPDNTMNIGECVGYLSVENLAQSEKPYIEVLVVEVFTPSFFWIQLRQKQKTFKKFMDDLHNFYVMKRKDYVIPPLVLEKGLNCACVYNGVWHRGIIKTVKPDLQVTVMFYDYGTLKTYPSEEIHYLHRMFSYLPAQAIPCGLVNTRPYKVSKWTRSATHHFAIRTQIPLIATIASINAEDNSMMVTLTDTTEEEDVHINDWLVEQKLAEHGKMVCTKYRNFPFRYYLESQKCFKRNLEIPRLLKKDKATQCNYALLQKFQKYSRNKVPSSDANAKVESADENSNNQADISEVDSTSSKEIDKKSEFLKSCSYLHSNFHICNRSLNSRAKSPKKIKALYKKLFNFKQISHSDNVNDKNNNKQSDNALSDKLVEQKLHKESTKLDNTNVQSNNVSNSSAELTPNSNAKVNEITSREYNIFDKFSNIPPAYAYHFRIQESDDELGLDCTERADKCIEQNRENYIDWSAICEKKTEKVEKVSHQNLIETTNELSLNKKGEMPLPESCFLKAVYNSFYFAVNDKDICWAPSGNINKTHDISPVLLKSIKKCISSEPENIRVAIPKKMLETLTERKLSLESLEFTSVSRNVNEAQADGSSQKSDNKVPCIKNSEHCSENRVENSEHCLENNVENSEHCTENRVENSEHCLENNVENSEHCTENRVENSYCFVKVTPFKRKVLEKLLAMHNMSGSTSELDSDDLSNSQRSIASWQNINEADENINAEESENVVNVYRNSSTDLSSEMNAKDISDPIKTESIDLDMEKPELHVRQTLTEEMVSFEASVSENNTESIDELILDESSLLNMKETEELGQTKEPLSTKEIVPIESESIKESSEIVSETSTIPVFNDIDIESDEDEWDVYIPPDELHDIVQNILGYRIEDCSNYKSNSGLKITEIDGGDPKENVHSTENRENMKDDNYEIPNSDKISGGEQYSNAELDNLVNQSKRSEEQTSAICSEESSNINDKNISNLTNNVSNSGKIQGKAKTLVLMLNKAKLLQKDC